MIKPRFVLLFLLFQLADQVYGMSCKAPLGIYFDCPTMINDDDKAFCCYSSDNIPYCCDIGDYIQNNSAIIAGILVGAVIFIIVVTICCCCFCSCCLLAKRRAHQGRVLYDPVAAQPIASSAIPPPVYSPYPLQPTMMLHTPPSVLPAYASGDPQPPVNPNYKDVHRQLP